MTYLEKKENEKYLLHLIEKGSLVNIVDTAEKLRCSKRTVERMIANLRLDGYEVKYSRSEGRYFMDC